MNVRCVLVEKIMDGCQALREPGPLIKQTCHFPKGTKVDLNPLGAGSFKGVNRLAKKAGLLGIPIEFKILFAGSCKGPEKACFHFCGTGPWPTSSRNVVYFPSIVDGEGQNGNAIQRRTSRDKARGAQRPDGRLQADNVV